MICTKCGNAIPEGTKFCSVCGTATAAPPPSGEALAASAPLLAVAVPAPSVPLPSDAHEAPAFTSRLGSKSLIKRVKGILLAPSIEWPVIASEPSLASAIYFQYVAPLAAIGAVAGFIGRSVIGVSVPFLGNYRTPIVSGFVFALLAYALTFVVVFVVAKLVDALAPTFGGQRDPLRALKVTAYSYTPAWIAGALQIIPTLGIVGLLAGLYGLYLLYLGLPVLMRCSKEKAIGYSIAILLCAFLLSLVIGAISAMAMGGVGSRSFAAGGTLSQTQGEDRATSDAAAGMLSGMFGGKTQADKERVGNAMQTLAKMGEQADQAGRAGNATGSSGFQHAAANNVDLGSALGAVGQVMTGGSDVKPVAFQDLKQMLPASIAGMKRDDASGESNEAMGIKGSSATAHYSSDAGGRVTVEITDMGSLSGLAGMAAKFDPNMQKETDTDYERTIKVNGQLLHQRYDHQVRSGEMSVLTGDRFSVTVSGSGVDENVLLDTLKNVDVGRLATLASTAK